MFEFFAAFILICITFVFIALSLIIKNKPVQGSCGGLANITDDGKCGYCGKPVNEGCDLDD